MIIIFGATGQAKICYDIITKIKCGNIIAFFDYDKTLDTPIPGIPLYHTSYYNKWKKYNNNPKHFVIAIGSPWGKERLEIHQKLLTEKNIPLSLQHPQSYIEDNCEIEMGYQISYGASILCHTKIGIQCIINTKASIDHDCNIGNDCEIGPMATLCGNVTLGNNVWIGANSTILQNLSIGNNSIIGAGSILTKNVLPDTIVAGNPAKKIADRTSEWDKQYKLRKEKEWI